jgi:ABC-type dipeptide/oligopeptide/nickel transport system ATPase component
MPLALRVESLWKSYIAGVRGCSARVRVLCGLSLTIEYGERVAIVGAAGAGKSTLAGCILGLRRPDAGVVDAPALVTGDLAIVGASRFLAPPDARRIAAASMLLFVPEWTFHRSWFDRVLLLRDGQLHRLDDEEPVRRVAERLTAAGGGGSPRR